MPGLLHKIFSFPSIVAFGLIKLSTMSGSAFCMHGSKNMPFRLCHSGLDPLRLTKSLWASCIMVLTVLGGPCHTSAVSLFSLIVLDKIMSVVVEVQ